MHSTVVEKFVDRNMFSLFASKGYHRLGYSHNLLVMSLLHQFEQDLETFIPTRKLCLLDDQYADRIFPKDFNVAFWSEWVSLRGSEAPPGSLFASLGHRLMRAYNKRQLNAELGALFPRGIPNLHSLFFILEDAFDWLMSQMLSLPRPYIAYIHLLPPHEPYTTRREFVDIFRDGYRPVEKPSHFIQGQHSPEQLRKERRFYDEYLAYADAEFGRLFDFLQARGVLDDTMIVFTSDHGELFERGIVGHVTPALYDPVIHVPLMIRMPGPAMREDVHTMTSAVDLLPTLLKITGNEVPDWVEGKTLPPFSPEEPDRPVFALDAKSSPKEGPINRGSATMLRSGKKLIHYFDRDSRKSDFELYDLAVDPEEMQNQYSKNGAAEMQEELLLHLKQADESLLPG